jgi:hypothetical protein
MTLSETSIRYAQERASVGSLVESGLVESGFLQGLRRNGEGHSMRVEEGQQEDYGGAVRSVAVGAEAHHPSSWQPMP